MKSSSQNPIFRLTPEHHQEAEALLLRDKYANIHQLHALETRGISAAPNHFWGLSDNGRLHSLLYSKEIENGGAGFLFSIKPEASGALLKFASKMGLSALIGKSSCMESVASTLPPRYSRKACWRVMLTRPDTFRKSYNYPTRQAFLTDIDGLTALYKDYEFGIPGESPLDIRQRIENNINDQARYIICELNNRIVAGEMIYSQTNFAGMLGSARILPAYRGKGIYHSLRTAGLEHLFEQEKVGMSFFVDSNKAIQKALEKTGGEYLENWHAYSVPPKNRRLIPRIKNAIRARIGYNRNGGQRR